MDTSWRCSPTMTRWAGPCRACLDFRFTRGPR
jgi:hypothetical protein